MRPGDYSFKPMSDAEAREIAAWRYDLSYDFYDAPNDPDDLAELLDPRRRESSYFSVLDEKGGLAAFFQFEEEGGTVDVGLGFPLAGLEFARRRFSPEGFTLSVATFNERAIRVYERAGFRGMETYIHHTSGGEHPSLSVAREA